MHLFFPSCAQGLNPTQPLTTTYASTTSSIACCVCCNQDASELSDLWASVGPLFAEGDVQRIAIALGTMRRSVALMAHVPEFQGSAQRLAVCA